MNSFVGGNSDSFQLLLNQISSDLAHVRDNLALVGLLYTSKLVVHMSWRVLNLLGPHVACRLASNERWLRSLGDWAVISGNDYRYFIN